MERKMDLCGSCAALMRESFQLKRVAGGIDNKITCAKCGRRRYGATYAVEKNTGKK